MELKALIQKCLILDICNTDPDLLFDVVLPTDLYWLVLD